MATSLVGAGGWGYFVGGLSAYARAFSFVEVNATFYQRVSKTTARRWRSAVPAGFTFAVKVHRDVTHRARLRATPTARAAFAQASRVASILRAPFLILEAPASLPLSREELEGLREFSSIADDHVRLGLEARAHARGPLPFSVRRTMEALGILDVVDLSRTTPRIEDDTVYARLFGSGEHNLYEFDDEELQSIDRSSRDGKITAYAFHGVRMYKDAARFLTFRRTGAFPAAMRAVGLASLAEVLGPDAHFPANRETLLREHGWKVVDVTPEKRAHASEVLTALPSATYANLPEMLRALEARGALTNR